jgi:tetratricopeptide (TPR) repeat protein
MFAQARYPEAIHQFQQAVEKDPENANSYYNLACVYHQLAKTQQNSGYWQQAEDFYNRCLDHNANHTDCYRALAVMLHEQGRTDASFRLLQGWADRDPVSPDPRIELARLCEETGRTDMAKVRLQEALALDAGNARALTALGHLHEVEGNATEAVANYQRSLYANRYQPQVAARIASLSSQVPTGTSLIARPMIQPVGESRMASRGSGTLR